MKKIKINDNINIDIIAERLKHICPNYSISTSGKKRIFVKYKSVMLVIKKNNNELKIQSDLNYKYKKTLLALFLGILLGVIGVVFVIIALYIIYNNKRKNIRREIFSKLYAEYNV